MRPLKLTMQAFGSYGKKTTIDFEEPNQNLFLITGDTGAGKTTIFDAIVFALYGEASSSSNKKDGVVLQSQYAALDLEPFVELTFSEGNGNGNEIYTVRRVPRHLRKKLRGAKSDLDAREIAGSVTLIMPDESEYPQKEADKKLEEIVGLTKSQFMQVAMIAQGEFMELLRAKSDDKKKIFRKLFNTELYQKIVDELHSRKRAKEKEIATIRTTCQAEAGHISILETYERAEELQLLKKRVMNGEIVVMTELLEELASMCDFLKAEKKTAEKEYQKVSELRDAKRDAYTKAENLMASFRQLEEAEIKLAECKAQEADIRNMEALMIQLRAAYEIKGTYERYEDAKGIVEKTKSALQEQKEILPKLVKAEQEASETENKEKELLNQEISAYSAISVKVKAAQEMFDKIANAKRDVTSRESAYNMAQGTAVTMQKKLMELESQERRWKEQEESLGDAENKLLLWKAKDTEADNLIAEAKKVDRLQAEVKKQCERANDAALAYEKVRGAYNQKKQEYDSIRQAFLDAQAGFLAKELKPGEKCPVCGSLEHPEPHKLEVMHHNLSQEMLDEMGKEVDILGRQQEEKASDARGNAELLKEKEKNLQSAFEDLILRVRKSIESSLQNPDLEASEKSDVRQKKDVSRSQEEEKILTLIRENALTLKQAKTWLVFWKTSIQPEGEKLERDVRKRREVRRYLQEAQTRKDQMKAGAEIAKEEENKALNNLAESKATLAALLNTSSEYASKGEAEAALKDVKRKRDHRQSLYEDAERNAKMAVSAKVNAQGLIQKYEQEIPEKEAECIQKKEVYETVRVQKDLLEAEWKDLTGRYQRNADKDLQKTVDAYNRKKNMAESQYSTAKATIGEQEKPILEILKNEMEEADAKWREAESIRARYSKEYDNNKNAYLTLSPKMDARKKVVDEHTKLDTLYKLVSGNVTDNRMDLETFVLRYYLERILYAANRRFQEMSAGQFELRMVDAEHAGKGKNRGLDLMVYSTVTGKEREVRTLSGGESFMAALSLALGMADQIQESAAAINLDMMFIDEGFGSLDDHSRNQAVRVLQEMAGGSRLIGIISHVTELKQEIDNQLLVKKDENGSNVKWVIS